MSDELEAFRRLSEIANGRVAGARTEARRHRHRNFDEALADAMEFATVGNVPLNDLLMVLQMAKRSANADTSEAS